MKNMKRLLQSLVLLFSLTSAVTGFAADAPVEVVDSGNTTWLLISSALVMLMTPGLAFFYAGMVNRKNVVSTLLQNYAALAIVGLLWVIIGYSLVFTEGNSLIGGTSGFMLSGMLNEMYGGGTGVPLYAFIAFQMMFAIITPALITGAIAERVNFKAWLLFMALWSLLVYVPIAHWVWGPGGWIAKLGGLDFAGGLVVHCSSGVSALIAAVMFGRRINVGDISRPNDISQIMLGAALLWFGWFGFNAGSAITSGTLASHAFMTTFVGAASAFVGWMLMDWILPSPSRPSAVGSAIGIVVGLVIITPAAGFVTVPSAIIMGLVGAAICNTISRWIKHKTKLDDTLDVFACHGVGGILGAIMTGLFASSQVNSAVTTQGLLVSGEIGLFKANLISVIVVAAFCVVMTFILLKLVNMITAIRVSETAETVGLDQAVHGEFARHHEDRRSYQ